MCATAMTFAQTGSHRIRAMANAGTPTDFRKTLMASPRRPWATKAWNLRPVVGNRSSFWWSGDEVHAVVRAYVEGDRIVRLRNYYHAPEVITEVCRELDISFRTHGYHPGSASS